MSSDQTAPGTPPPPGPPPGPPAGPPASTAPQQAPQQPEQSQQPQQQQGAVELHLQGNMMTAGMISPSVRVNGYPVPTSYGVTTLPVYAGRNHLDINMQWLMTYGKAAIDVDVAPGQTVPVWYAPPFHQFSKGAIGPDKQKRPGAVLFIAILAIVIVIVVLAAVAGAMG